MTHKLLNGIFALVAATIIIGLLLVVTSIVGLIYALISLLVGSTSIGLVITLILVLAYQYYDESK